MDVEALNNSPEHIDGRNEATTITNNDDCRRQASVLTQTNTNYRSSRHCRSTNNNDNVVTQLTLLIQHLITVTSVV